MIDCNFIIQFVFGLARVVPVNSQPATKHSAAPVSKNASRGVPVAVSKSVLCCDAISPPPRGLIRVPGANRWCVWSVLGSRRK